MSHDKAISSGKECRRPYTGGKAFDAACRNHGGCPYCESKRQFFDRKRRLAAAQDLKEWQKLDATADLERRLDEVALDDLDWWHLYKSNKIK